MAKNYYEILGLTDEDKKLPNDEFKKKLKKVFKPLAVKYHPDKNQGDKDAEEKFKEINEAYEILSDDDKRQKYDLEQNGMDGFGFDPFSAFRGNGGFSDFFSNFGGHRHVEKGNDVYVNVNVSLEDIFNEKEIEVTYNKHAPCHHCKGTGAEGGKVTICPVCGGRGVVTNTRIEGNVRYATQTPCSNCRGVGHIAEKKCNHCSGTGNEAIHSKIKFKIPSGAFDNASMLMEGHGDIPKTQNGIPGNLIVTFHIIPHDYFKVENGMLTHDEYIPFTDCLLGCKRTIKGINGKEYILNIPELTRDEKRFAFRDIGMWGKPFTVNVKYEMPDKLSDKQKQLLKDFYK